MQKNYALFSAMHRTQIILTVPLEDMAPLPEECYGIYVILMTMQH